MSQITRESLGLYGWISPHERRQIIVRMREKLSAREVAEIMGISVQRVHQILREEQEVVE